MNAFTSSRCWPPIGRDQPNDKVIAEISFQVASSHARGCRKENGRSTIVHEKVHTRVPKNGMLFSWQWRSVFVECGA